MRNKMISVVKSGLFALFCLFIGATAHATIGLPEGYTEVEYIASSDGRQRINTGVIPTNDLPFYVKFQNDNTAGDPSGYGNIFGSRFASTQQEYQLTMYNGGTVSIGNRNGNLGFNTSAVHTISFNGQNTLVIDGVSTTITKGSISSSFPIYLFGINENGSFTQGQAGKIYRISFGTDGSVFNGIPARRNSDQAIGIYDTVSGDFLTTPSGTGTFTAGNPVATYTELEYIESSGTQYIDTGFSPDANTRVDWKGQLISGDSGVLLGARVAGSNPGRFFPLAFSTGTNYRTTFGGNDVMVSGDTSTVYTGSFRPAESKSIINGTTYSFVSPNFSKTESNNLLLFGVSGYGVQYYLSTGKIWYVKIWDDGMLVRDLVPAKRDSDGRIGMFDNVSRAFFDNVASSSVNFIGGTVCPAGQNQITYTSATGTVSQNGTPTPANPITPTFYTQGQMVLRKVGNYADSYDATTGKITRRVGVKVLNGTEPWVSAGSNNVVTQYLIAMTKAQFASDLDTSANYTQFLCSHLKMSDTDAPNTLAISTSTYGIRLGLNTDITVDLEHKLANAKAWLAQHPVTVYYPLAEPVEEDWAAEQCSSPIKIATVKYNNAAFSDVVTGLNTAISTIKTVVANTISQTAAVASLQSGKQTKPADAACPDYRQCLLVEDSSGVPHWYEIMDPFYNLFKPAITNNISAASVTSAESYTQLEYIRSDGTAYIDTGYTPTANTKIEVVAKMDTNAGNVNIAGSGCSDGNGGSTYSILTINSYNDTHPEFKFGPAYNWNSSITAAMTTKQTLAISRTQFTVNGDVLATNTTAITCPSGQGTPAPFYLFQGWRPTITSANNMVQIYGFRIYENDVLQMNLVPAKLGNTVGMYNTVNGDFLTTPQGALTAGTVVANTDVPSTPTWTATFAANNTYNILASTVYGSAKCNATSGSANTAATSTQMSNANWNTSGNYCWCHVNNVTDSNNNSGIPTSNIWVWVSMSSGTCSTSCANKCATTMQTGTNTAFRKAITGIQ